ncbi:cyclic nucleotide-binding domain-containing protein [Candidatus Poribacteria bacterium]|nr:cyclic nucleotide-binding domain-containing protein [Candidatus Poribacteria bacterium]
MDFDVARKTLASSELFGGLGRAELGYLLITAGVRRFAAKDQIFRKGERAGTNLFLIVSGTAHVLSERTGQVEVERGPGTALGEIGHLNPEGKRTRTVIAGTAMELLEWDIPQWDEDLASRIRPHIEKIAFERLATGLE